MRVVAALCGISCKSCHNGQGLWLHKQNKGVRDRWGGSGQGICKENIGFRFYQQVSENWVF